MKVIVTCGPSYEPIDQVRRITNFSTGELGILLANALSKDGHEVLCFKGVGATCPLPLDQARLVPFTTNEDLRTKLAAESGRGGVDVLFHAAALCDFKVAQAIQADGEPPSTAKIPSRGGKITLVLDPLPKLINDLRGLFPNAKLVGWKHELDGERKQTVDAGRRQMQEARTDACVVNGAAFGPGFGLYIRGANSLEFADKAALCHGLAEWVGRAGGTQAVGRRSG